MLVEILDTSSPDGHGVIEPMQLTPSGVRCHIGRTLGPASYSPIPDTAATPAQTVHGPPYPPSTELDHVSRPPTLDVTQKTTFTHFATTKQKAPSRILDRDRLYRLSA